MNIFYKFLNVIIFSFLMTSFVSGQIIPPSTIVTNNWQTCGTRTQVEYPNDITVTASPYNADNTGAKDATAAIQAAINAETANHAVFFPAGKYLINGSLNLSANNIILRGSGTNSVLVCVGSNGSMLNIGNSGNQTGVVTDHISVGSTNGSTSITLTTTPSFSVGNLISLSQSDVLVGSTNFPIINVHQYNYNIQQQEIVTGISGNVVTLSDPIIWNFTNIPVVLASQGNTTHGVGIENLTITSTNATTGAVGSYNFTVQMYNCYDCWVTNCSIIYSYQYAFALVSSSHVTIFDDAFHLSQGSGADHSGLFVQYISECLLENNIIADGLQPALEVNQGVVGNVFFGNFMTNNLLDIDFHNTHPLMNDFEENKLSLSFEIDGFFGSSSHQTLLRNAIESPELPLIFRRWTTYINVVGNVLGTTNSGYTAYSTTANGSGLLTILSTGYPNIGNQNYTSTSNNPVAWNYPLSSGSEGDWFSGLVYFAPVFTFTNTQTSTSNLIGNFVSIVGTMTNGNLGGEVYTIVIQDNNNTNIYYPTNGLPLVAVTAGTSSSLYVNQAVTVTSGMRLFVSGQSAYQQFQSNDITSDTISGNWDYFHNSVIWNSGGVQTIPSSLVYPSGAPTWWNMNGTLPWPAIGSDLSPMVSLIPAEIRYEGITIPSAPTGLQALPWMN